MDSKALLSISQDFGCDLATRIERIPSYISVVELASILGLKKTCIYDKVTEGRIPHFLFDSSIRFDPHILAEWLRARAVNTPAIIDRSRRAA